jgi:hypothetical protein
MATLDGYSSLKDGSGSFQLTASELVNVDSVSLICGAVFDSHASSEIIMTELLSLVGDGILSCNGGLEYGSNISLICGSVFFARSVLSEDADAYITARGVMHAKPTLTSSVSPILFVSNGIFSISGVSTSGPTPLILFGCASMVCDIDDYYENLEELINSKPEEPCYYVHINRIVEAPKMNTGTNYSKKCYAGLDE